MSRRMRTGLITFAVVVAAAAALKLVLAWLLPAGTIRPFDLGSAAIIVLFAVFVALRVTLRRELRRGELRRGELRGGETRRDEMREGTRG